MKILLTAIISPLILLFFQWRMKLLRRPRLVIDTPSGNGWRVADKVALLTNPELRENRLWLRVRVRNDGKTTAKGCQVFLMQTGAPGASLQLWRALDSDPAPLFWAHSEHQEPGDRLATDLPPGVHRFVDFVLLREESAPFIQLNSPTLIRDFEDRAAKNSGLSADLLVIDEDGNCDRAIVSFVTGDVLDRHRSWLEEVQWKPTVFRIRPR